MYVYIIIFDFLTKCVNSKISFKYHGIFILLCRWSKFTVYDSKVHENIILYNSIKYL